MLGGFEVGIVNPELAAIAYRHAGRSAVDLAPEFVGRFEPNLAGAYDRTIHQMNDPFLPEFGLDVRRSGAPVAHLREKGFDVEWRERLGVTDYRCDCRRQGSGD